MPFDVVTIRTQGDRVGDPLYPDLNARPAEGPIQLEPADVGVRLHWVATGLSVGRLHGGKVKTVLDLNELYVACFLTDSRVFFSCHDYNKGGGWAGVGVGMAVAAAANTVSKARAARQSRGTALVGHVRHDWPISVGGVSRRWIVPGSLRLNFQDDVTNGYLDMQVPKNLDPHDLALKIARSIAAFRLGNRPSLTDDQRDDLIAVTRAGQLINDKGNYALHHLPHALRVKS